MTRKIKVTGKKAEKIDPKLVAQRLGARIINIPELKREETDHKGYTTPTIYEPLGSPVMVPVADKLNIYHYGSRMLRQYGMSLDDIVGYRILDADEEIKFRQECAEKNPSYLCLPVVRYYGRLR
ncbi:MAG: hypothetical protein AABX05_04100 [Nanoarchaeota archaeon]